MNDLLSHDVSLNIRYDAPEEIWNNIGLIYSLMPGWLGAAQDGCPCWFSYDIYNKHEKSVSASVEPSGLQICANMRQAEWVEWIENFKTLATQALGYEVGDAADGYEFVYF